MAVSARRRGGGGPGLGQWMALGGAVVVILGLTFALGLLVGRQWARHSVVAGGSSAPELAKKGAPAARRGGLAADVLVDRPPEATEKLTFYQTLTEPLHGPGAPRTEAKPVSVKLPTVAPVPASASAAPASVPAPPKPTPALPPAPAKAVDVAGPGTGPAPTPAKQTGASAPAPAIGSPATSGSSAWTIQVGAFKNRKQADEMRQHLAATGVEAYVASVAVKEGQVPFRVRIGAFKTREEAAATAERLRGQRSLTAFVTLK